MSKAPGKPPQRASVKTTVELPADLWRAAKIRAMDEQIDLRTVLIRALERYLGGGDSSGPDGGRQRVSDTPAPRTTPPAAPRGSLARRGRRLVRYVLGFVTAVLVIDAIVGEKGLLALLAARRDFTRVEASLAGARAENARLRE